MRTTARLMYGTFSSPHFWRAAALVAVALVLGFALTQAPVAQATTTTQYTNNAAITIPSQGLASIYPSTVNVTGITGDVVDVDVTLFNVSHDDPLDLDIILVSPNGTRVVLISDACSTTVVTNVTWTIDDDAAAAFPNAANCPSGSYQPTNIVLGSADALPGVNTSYDDRLDDFNDENVNGIWALYVFDDAASGAGQIAGGWRLTLKTIPFGNLLQNGAFSSDVSSWGFFGATGTWNNGALELAIAPGNANGGAFQIINQLAPQNGSAQLSLDMANLSAGAKSVSITARNSTFSEVRTCTFTLAPFSPRQNYRMFFYSASADWEPIVAQITMTGPVSQAIQVDNVNYFYSFTSSSSPGTNPTGCEIVPPSNTQLLFDGGFDAGLAAWAPFGDATANVVGGVMNLSRSGAGGEGGIFQFNPYAQISFRTLQLNMQLGNASPAFKTLAVVLREGGNWGTLRICYIALPGNTPLRSFTMRVDPTEDWGNTVVQFFLLQSGAGQNVLIDNLVLQSLSGNPNIVRGTECWYGQLGLAAAEDTALVARGDRVAYLAVPESAAVAPALAFPNPANGVIADGGIAPLPSDSTAPVAPAEEVKPGE